MDKGNIIIIIIFSVGFLLYFLCSVFFIRIVKKSIDVSMDESTNELCRLDDVKTKALLSLGLTTEEIIQIELGMWDADINERKNRCQKNLIENQRSLLNNIKSAVLVEKLADDGQISHRELVDMNGLILWSEKLDR